MMEELCYTREFRDNKGNNRYRLGCESKEKCNVYTQILIGKRHLSERALPGDCYGCCSSDICNTKLCQGTSTTAPQINVKGCPANFVAFNGKCYLFDPTERNWKDQVSHCQGMGAGLLTIHSEEENNFIVSEMKNYNNIPGYYTGGVFGRDGQWEWMDGSVFDYTNWNSNYPNPHHKYDTNIVVVHESVPAGLQAGQWVTAGSTTHTYDGVICETKQQ